MSIIKRDIIVQKIGSIETIPEMYIGKKNIHRLHMFIAGYLHRQYEIDSTFRTNFEGFTDFVNDYYNAGARGADWAHIITTYESDEEQAFKKFYKLFHLFIDSLEQEDGIDL